MFLPSEAYYLSLANMNINGHIAYHHVFSHMKIILAEMRIFLKVYYHTIFQTIPYTDHVVIREIQETQVRLKLNETHHILVYAHYMNLLEIT
jgi:hypothetical protein